MRYLIIFCCLLSALGCKRILPVHDGFEGSNLSKIWDTDKFEPRAVTLQNQIKHTGSQALKITINQGDKYEAGNDSSLTSERDELTEAKTLYSLENKGYEQAFSLFIPANFPIVPTRLVLAQWKQKCPQPKCSDDSPVLALRYTNGVLQITIQTGPHRQVVYETTNNLRNKWTSFRFQTDLSRSKGFVKAWINEKQVLNYTGKTGYGAERGYTPGSLFYFKMGLYRDRMPQPMTIYIDDYSKKPLFDQQ